MIVYARRYLLSLVLISNTIMAFGQWAAGPSWGVAITTTGRSQSYPILSIGSNQDVMMAWHTDGGYFKGISAQSLNRDGVILWKPNGVEVCSSKVKLQPRAILRDSTGHTIVIWNETRNEVSDIYIQRLDKFGLPVLPKNGVPLFDPPKDRTLNDVLQDGFGGAFLAWTEYEGSSVSMYLQHVNAYGESLWTRGSVPVTINRQHFISTSDLVDDGHGGVIVCWLEKMSNRDNAFYSQRIDSIGNTRWSPNGITVCDLDYGEIWGSDAYRSMSMVADGSGGAVFVFHDLRFGRRAMFFQHIDSAGSLGNERNGMLISDTATHNSLSSILASGNRSVYISWYSSQTISDGPYSHFVQKYSPDGLPVWSEPIKVHDREAGVPQIVSDNDNGFIAEWLIGSETTTLMYAQRISADGVRRWNPDGVLLVADMPGTGYYRVAPLIESDGDQGAVIAYVGRNNPQSENIYIKHINGDGTIGLPRDTTNSPNDSAKIDSSQIGIINIVPNPTTEYSEASFAVPVSGQTSVVVYNALGEVVRVVFDEYVKRDVIVNVWIDLADQSSGVYYCRLAGPHIDETMSLILQH